MQKTLTLIITAAILYMIFQYSINDFKQTNTPTNIENKVKKVDGKNPSQPEITGNILEKTLSKVLINILKTEEGRLFLENIVSPMDKPLIGSGKGYKLNNDNLINSMFKINTFGEGIEGPASCGHLVTVKYKILTLNNITVEERVETFPLGSNKTIPALNAVIVGMKTGQVRHATIPGKYTNSVKKGANSSKGSKSSFKLNIELKEIIPKNFVDEDVKIFDNEIAYHLPLLCGQTITYDAKITKLSNGEIVYDSRATGKKINMLIGNVVYPVIFSHALHNKIPIGTRTAIAKGRLFKSYASNNSSIFPDKILPNNEYYMLELMNFEDVR